MDLTADQIPPETKWAMSAKGLTGALTAHLNAIHEIVGKENYSKAIRAIWAEIGRASAQEIKSSGRPVNNAEEVAQVSVATCVCAMGPEYQIEQIEASEDRAVMKITACPWQNRLKEFGITHDLMSACDTAFWEQFIKHLNPKITMKHGKQMHRGAPYCEWIFEAR